MIAGSLRAIIGMAVVFPAALLAQTGKPTISAITNAASYATGSISPGEMVVIFGSSMGPSGIANLQLVGGKLATTLSGVQALFNGIAAPLVYASSAQIAAMVPYGIAGASTTAVQVAYQGVVSNPFQVIVTAATPGIFSANASGSGQAARANADGSINSSSHPATPGTFVTFYLTGVGQTSPLSSDGSIAAFGAREN